MDFAEFVKIIVFGIIEGITEWLPISSTGHLMLAEEFLKPDVSEHFFNVFLVVIQFGAIMAVVLLFWNNIWPFTKDPEQNHVKIPVLALWVKILVACLPAAIIGLLFDDFLDSVFYTGSRGPITVGLMLIIYGISEKIALSDEEKAEVLDWINRLENGDNTKRILRKGLADESLTEEEKLIVAYNVFDGHRNAKLLRNAENNEVGLSRVRRSIGSVFSLDSDDKLIDTVQQYICIAINREETCADIARRYQYFGMNGGIM